MSMSKRTCFEYDHLRRVPELSKINLIMIDVIL